MAVQTVASTTATVRPSTSVPPPRSPAASAATRFPLGPIFACEECFGPLEVAYDFPSGDPEELRKRIEAGPQNIWRYAPLLPVPADVADKPNINPGFTKLVKADNLARELGVDRRAVRQGRLRQPDALLQGPRRRHRRRGRPRLRLHHPVLLLHRQPRRRRRRRRRPRRLPLLRVHPARPGAGQGRHGRGLRRRARRHRGQLRRRQPLLLRADRRPARRGLGLRQRQPAPVLRARAPRPWRTRSASSSAGGCPTSSSSRSPPARSSRRSTRGCRS